MIYRSPYPDVEIPDVGLAEFVLRHAVQKNGALAERPALIDGLSGAVLTYGALGHAVEACAGALARRGLGVGDVLAIHAPNCPEYAVVLYAAAKLGALTTTLNPLYTEHEVAKQLTDSGARFLVAGPACLDTARAAAQRVGIERLIVLGPVGVRGDSGGSAGQHDGTEPLQALLAEKAPLPTPTADAVRRFDPALQPVVLPYSSGTTGLPKGVVLTHRNLIANLRQSEGCLYNRPLDESDTIVAALPFFHIYGIFALLSGALSRGATVVTLPRFDLARYLGVLERYRVTFLHAVPPMALMLAREARVAEYDLSSVRLVFSAAAPLPAGVAEEVRGRLGCPVFQGYGQTETSPMTTHGPDHPDHIRPESVGVLVPNTEARVVDTVSGKLLGAGESGELHFRGPQVMQGYLNNPQATAETIDADGWLHSGDIGRVDGDGYFYILDRLKEFIKYKGYQIAPAELEALLLTHPDVADAAVIPSPDERAGEVPKALVVLRPGAGTDAGSSAGSGSDSLAAQIIAHVSARVAPYKRIRRLAFVDAIPKSASGKILRRVLVEQEREAAS